MQSFVLPTREGVDVACRIAADAEGADEVLVVCDTPDDPITEATDRVREAAGETSVAVIVAGEPAACSGKCNALAAGTERATGDVIVWTDDDFDHEGWVGDVKRAIADHVGPDCPAVSTAPIFLSESPFARLLEGPSALGAALGLRLESVAWGGTLAFRRDAVDVSALVADLRRTVTDDALLTRRLSGFTADPRLVRCVETRGTASDTLSRNARWVQTARYLDPAGLAFGFLLNLVVAIGAVVAPLLVVPLVTLAAGVAYARFGLRRVSFLWTVVGYALGVPLLLWGLTRTEFDWGSRRYRWHSLYDVEIVDRDTADDSSTIVDPEPRD